MSLLKPRLLIDDVIDITPELLRTHGLCGLLLDLDNTLIAYGSYEDRRELDAWVSDLHLAGMKLYLLSNALPERVRYWTGRLGFDGVGLASKPFPRAFRKAADAVGLKPEQMAMVGDQLFTDVLGGNLNGMFTIMVRPLADNALPHTKLARRIERLVLKRYGHAWHGRAPHSAGR
ncbi:YqeG family HAD IIIA-type phosphatase [Deinococcus maricopensis]|uniref:HAD superfamily (Subfamily IIIA) phosphatase, TIGR01668 n=1 Tax=Deinococcus maricopensis (strain DSM 21211 / LMG 22137 / NRRL B-23946 / LB-34) TaxID=709986 RepID=E8U3Z3_DEIML|nr:YqeG family HAD IIIA-type phosphatase [Deinococcus maricopensis]ADV65687.1 HAD superfamily (subfamily IIIA) phosphatase, TIGR01668 [Deinococcus maricopensis DSM 21211]